MEHDQSSYFWRGPDDFCWGRSQIKKYFHWKSSTDDHLKYYTKSIKPLNLRAHPLQKFRENSLFE